MAYDISIGAAYSGRTAFNLSLYVRRNLTDHANWRTSCAWELRANNPERRSQTYALDQFAWSVNIGGQGFSGTHSLDFRGGQSHIVLGSGTTGWFGHNGAGELHLIVDARHGTTSVFGTADPAAAWFITDILGPHTPSGLSASRVSDSQQTLGVNVPLGAVNMVWQRQTDDGQWQGLATTGAVNAFTDKSTTTDKKYTYRAAASNGGGQSGWSNLASVFTAPAAPSGVSATRIVADDIRVDASGRPRWASTFNIRDAGVLVASGVSLPWTHVDPDPAAVHTYTVQGVVAGVAGAWSAPSNAVQLITVPNAPSGLHPNGGVRSSDEDVVFAWAHSPVDSSPQSAFELQYRLDGAAWATLTGTTVQKASASIDVGVVEWQVRTKGAHPDWSPWSPIATLTVIDRPGVAVVQPVDIWDASILSVEWTWFQAQSRPQSAWRVELLDATGAVVETRNGSGATTALQFNHRLTEGQWTVRAMAATGEVWSAWGSETFVVAFTPPGAPVLAGEWDDLQGGVQLAVSGEEYGGAVLVDGVWFARIGD